MEADKKKDLTGFETFLAVAILVPAAVGLAGAVLAVATSEPRAKKKR